MSPAGKPHSPAQPGLWGFGGGLWLPGPTGAGAGFGSIVWTPAGTYTQPAPTSGLITQRRRGEFDNVAVTQNQNLGIRAIGAPDFMFYGGSAAPGRGGFYIATRFIVEKWPANTCRIFVGLSATPGNSAVVSDNPVVSAAGLWHDTTDGTSFSFAGFDGAGNVNKGNPTDCGIAAGKGYLFEMWSYPGISNFKAKLSALDTDVCLQFWTGPAGGPANTVFLAPQVEMSNGTANTTVNTVALSIESVLATNQNRG